MAMTRGNPFQGIGIGVFSIAARANGPWAVALHLLSVVALVAFAAGLVWIGLFGCLLSSAVAAIHGRTVAIGILFATAAAGLLFSYLAGRLLFD